MLYNMLMTQNSQHYSSITTYKFLHDNISFQNLICKLVSYVDSYAEVLKMHKLNVYAQYNNVYHMLMTLHIQHYKDNIRGSNIDSENFNYFKNMLCDYYYTLQD